MANKFYIFQDTDRLKAIQPSELGNMDVALVGYGENDDFSCNTVRMYIYLSVSPTAITDVVVNNNFIYPDGVTSGETGWYSVSSTLPSDSISYYVVNHPLNQHAYLCNSIGNIEYADLFLDESAVYNEGVSNQFIHPSAYRFIDGNSFPGFDDIHDVLITHGYIGGGYAQNVQCHATILTAYALVVIDYTIYCGWNDIIGLYVYNILITGTNEYPLPNGSGTSIGSRLVCSGDKSNTSTIVMFIPGYLFAFDIINRIYIAGTPCPDNLIRGACSPTFNNRYVFVVGATSAGPTNKVYVYDYYSKTWQTVTTFDGSLNWWNIDVEFFTSLYAMSITVLEGPVFKGYLTILTTEDNVGKRRYIYLHPDSLNTNLTIDVNYNYAIEKLSVMAYIDGYVALATNSADSADVLMYNPWYTDYPMYMHNGSLFALDRLLPVFDGRSGYRRWDTHLHYTKLYDDTDKSKRLCLAVNCQYFGSSDVNPSLTFLKRV